MKQSAATKRKQATARELYEDGWSTPFGEQRLWLRGPVADWPRIKRLDFKTNRELYRGPGGYCWYCDQPVRHRQCHHIVGGTKGRCDSFANLFEVCHECHELIQSSVALLGRVLFKKWEHDRLNTNWVRSTLLLGRHLPDLIPD